MSRGPNASRRADLEAALERAKPKDEVTLEVLAALWGVSKQRFVNILREIEKLMDMPAWREGPRGMHLYPARRSIRVLLAYEKRNDAAANALQKRAQAILGRGAKRTKGEPEDDILPIEKLATLSRVMAETEQRERDQGLFVALHDSQLVAGRVFSMISAFLSDLDANVDPNGLLPVEIRNMIRDGGRTAALQIHAELKDMLTGDATPKPRSTKGSRGAHGRAGGARARRPGGRRVAVSS